MAPSVVQLLSGGEHAGMGVYVAMKGRGVTNINTQQPAQHANVSTANAHTSHGRDVICCGAHSMQTEGPVWP